MTQMLNANRLECQVTLIAPVFLHTLEMEQTAQVCIHMQITIVTMHACNIENVGAAWGRGYMDVIYYYTA